MLTKNRAYLEFMDREWWATTDALFSPPDGLFYRDATYVGRREANGEGVFWSRGNGWVLASLAILLEEMPRDFASRPRYERLFRSLAARVTALQPADGLWRSSLLDPTPNPNPESSSSAFFCFALAQGVRLGLLPAGDYSPVIARTWAALQQCVRDDGHFGRVQQPGAGPGSAEVHHTAPYGVGAFLMAGTAVYRMAAESSAGELSAGPETGRDPRKR